MDLSPKLPFVPRPLSLSPPVILPLLILLFAFGFPYPTPPCEEANDTENVATGVAHTNCEEVHGNVDADTRSAGSEANKGRKRHDTANNVENDEDGDADGEGRR